MFFGTLSNGSEFTFITPVKFMKVTQHKKITTQKFFFLRT